MLIDEEKSYEKQNLFLQLKFVQNCQTSDYVGFWMAIHAS
jgi:hypothetical protein